MTETLLEIVHIITALFMILVVLVQGGNQGGVGAAFGGGNSGGVLGATGATSLLGKLTYGAAGIFMVTSLSLSIIQGTAGDIGLEERLRDQSGVKTPVDDEPIGTSVDGGVEPLETGTVQDQTPVEGVTPEVQDVPTGTVPGGVIPDDSADLPTGIE